MVSEDPPTAEDEIWFTKLKKSIVKQIRTRGLRSGEVLSGSAYGLDRGIVVKICDHMMRQTTKFTASMEDRFYMTLTYNACGRGGEAACANPNPNPNPNNFPQIDEIRNKPLGEYL